MTGCATGADQIPFFFKNNFDIDVKEFPAESNKKMAEYASLNGNGELIAFWDGVSRGTRDMIDVAGKYGLIVRIIEYGMMWETQRMIKYKNNGTLDEFM